jgi:hypothetical protein
MTADRWFESKKGYTLVHSNGDRYTVFWTGDKDGPWRVVCRGVFSDNFKSVFDGMTYVDQKTGTVSDRIDILDLDPAKREAFKAKYDQKPPPPPSPEGNPWKAAQEGFDERAKSFRGEWAGVRGQPNWFKQAAESMQQQAKAAQNQQDFRRQFESQFENPFTVDEELMAAMQKEAERRHKAAEEAERVRKRQKDAERSDEFYDWFDRMFKNHSNSGGSYWQGRTNHTGSGDQAGPARSSSGKRAWHVVLELPGRGPWPEDDVKKQFRKLAMAFHPDRPGGDTAKMAELNTAWEQACAALGIK